VQRRAAPSFCSSVSEGGASSSRCRFQPRITRLLTVKASARCVSARHGVPSKRATGSRRPPAPIGWGSLTGPTNFWRSLSRSALQDAGLRPASVAVRASYDARTTLSQARRARRRVRTADIQRARAPSIGSSRTFRPGWADFALVVHSHVPAPHPVTRRENTLPRQWPGVSPRATQPSHASFLAGRTKKMRLTNFCNQLALRAPSGLSDSRLHGPAGLTARRHVRSASTNGLGTSSGEASLDGDAPASASQRLAAPTVGSKPRRRWSRGPRAVLVEPRSELLRTGSLQWWRFQPHTEIIAQPLTSCVTAIARPGLSTKPSTRRQAPSPPPLRQEQWAWRRQDAFHRRVLPPPFQLAPAKAFASGTATGLACASHGSGHGITGSPPLGHSVSTGNQLSTSFHHLCARQGGQTHANSNACLRHARR